MTENRHFSRPCREIENTVGNDGKRELNDRRSVDMSETPQTTRIIEKKKKTYAEAVKEHNVKFMEGISEHISLKRNNPFLKHLTSLI